MSLLIGLAFGTMLDALAEMPSYVTFWTMLYLLAAIALALGVMLTLNLVVTTALEETFPALSTQTWKCPLIACLLGFFTSVVYTCEGGVHFFTLIDYNIVQYERR